MKNNPNHGNRLRPPVESYENKKKRSRDRYAATQLKTNPFWKHNKILRDLVNLYGVGVEIPSKEFNDRGFDPQLYKKSSTSNTTTYLHYDIHKITITKNKTITIWKISN
jgi:hypothetical protein